MSYLIRIFNEADIEVYHTIIERENENEALEQLLKEVYINNGDKISIVENFDE